MAVHAVQFQHGPARRPACSTQRSRRCGRPVGCLRGSAPRRLGPGADGGVRHVRAPRLQSGHRFQPRSHPRHHAGHLRVPRLPGHRWPAVHGRRHSRSVRSGDLDGARGLGRQRRHGDARRRRRVHPDTGCLARHSEGEPWTDEQAGRWDRGDALTQPAPGRRLQVQPAQRRPGRFRCHVHHCGTGERTPGGRTRGREADALYGRPQRGLDRFLRLHRVLCRRSGERARHRRDPKRRGQDRCRSVGRRFRRLLGRYRRAAAPGSHGRQPAGRSAMGVHDAGLGRQDPDGLQFAVCDGVAGQAGRGIPDRDRKRRGRRPARHRHARRRSDEPQSLSGRRDRLPVPQPHRMVAGGRAWARHWCRRR